MNTLKISLTCFLLSCAFVTFSQNQPYIDWVKVEGGSFYMGCESSDDDCYPDEQPRHKVTINTFSISKYEVTVADYRLFCKATNRNMPHAPSWGWIDSHPIVNIKWQDAQDYCKWLGVRLPTEAEWEYAARGGKKSKGYQYSGSNDWNSVGWSYENSSQTTHPVGLKEPNELGIYDMSGNAWEWVNDDYEIFYYQDSPQKNPQGPQKGIGKCNRGGCFNFDYLLMKVFHRRGSGDETIGFGTGFRVAKN